MAERVPLLLYHSIAAKPDPRFVEWTVTPELFAAHLDYLVGNGYRTLTVSELAERVFERGEALEPRSVAITFDDGFEDFYTSAWPQLRRRSLTATVFIATGYVGRTSAWLAPQGEPRRRMLSWAQIAELAAAGIECGAHGHGHLQLDTIPVAAAATEIERSKRALEAVAGAVTSFSYPHGYYTRRVQRQVEQAGFRSACAVKDALSAAADDRFAISRAVVRAGTSTSALARVLRGDALRVAPGPRTLRRAVWRILRRAGAVHG